MAVSLEVSADGHVHLKLGAGAAPAGLSELATQGGNGGDDGDGDGAALGRAVQPALIGLQGLLTTIPQCTSSGCVTQCRCIVPAHSHVQLNSVDQSEPVAHPYKAAAEARVKMEAEHRKATRQLEAG